MTTPTTDRETAVPDHPLSNGKYEPRPYHTVWTWPEGEPCPEGFKEQPNGDAVLLVEGTDDVDRDIHDRSGIIRPGGALVYTSDGEFLTVDADDVQHYADTHEKVSDNG